ncbi:MAG TPA: recombinase family protein [Tepidisphaeraceae bacterium]|nr:recombinase family protein [Tepidisphaeraceae bacterium]
MLDPTGDTIIRRFGRNVKGKSPEHYIKQKNESVRLVPGDPQHVEVVHRIFYLVYVERRSFHSIAKQLNDEGVPSPRGVLWEGSTVKGISDNRTYVGVLRRGKDTNAIYWMTALGSPAPSGITATELRDKSGRIKLRPRPSEDWLLRDDPALAGFLPSEVCDIARPAIEATMRIEGEAKPPVPRSKDKHRNSPFFLKNILKSKQGGFPMTGKRSGRHGEKRYYHTSRGKRCPKTGDIYNRSINARALEKEMLRVLREVLMNKPDLMDALRRAAEHHASKEIPADDRLQIEKQLMKKQRQIAAALESLTGVEALDRPIDMKLAEYRAEVGRLKAALRSTPAPAAPVDIDAAVEHLAEQLADFASNLDGDDYGIIAEMFGLLVHRLEGDLQTKDAEVVLALPDWLGREMATTGMMGLDAVFACRTQNETHRENPMVLAEFRCAMKASHPACYDCRRVRNAA